MKKNENRPQDTGRSNPQEKRDNPQGSRRDQDTGRSPQDTRREGSEQDFGGEKNPQGTERSSNQPGSQQGNQGTSRTNPQGTQRGTTQSSSTQGTKREGQQGTQGSRSQGSRSGSVEERLQGNWSTYKDRLQEDYDDLTDEDLQYEQGKESDLMGRIEKRTGMNRDQFSDWMDSQEEMDDEI